MWRFVVQKKIGELNTVDFNKLKNKREIYFCPSLQLDSSKV